jgi:DNA-directed RNA polymerase subunit K/omega
VTDENVLNEPTPEQIEVADAAGAVEAPWPLAPPIQSRFLFVDVAALRAKQLRRGALPRLKQVASEAVNARPDLPHKAERIAMEEVRQGLIAYALPEDEKNKAGTEEAGS